MVLNGEREITSWKVKEYFFRKECSLNKAKTSTYISRTFEQTYDSDKNGGRRAGGVSG